MSVPPSVPPSPRPPVNLAALTPTQKIALWAIAGFLWFGAYAVAGMLRDMQWHWSLTMGSTGFESFIVYGLFGAVIGAVIGYFASKA